MTDLTRELSNAQKVLDTDAPECIAIDPRDITHRASGTGGLDMNQVVCYNKDLIEEEYLKCPPLFVPPPTEAPVVPPTEALEVPKEPAADEPATDVSEQTADSSANGVSALWSSILLVSVVFVCLF